MLIYKGFQLSITTSAVWNICPASRWYYRGRNNFIQGEGDTQMTNKSHISVLNISEDKRKLMELTLKGQKRFKIWCEQHDIDYKKLSDDEIMEMINETIAKHRRGRKVKGRL